MEKWLLGLLLVIGINGCGAQDEPSNNDSERPTTGNLTYEFVEVPDELGMQIELNEILESCDADSCEYDRVIMFSKTYMPGDQFYAELPTMSVDAEYLVRFSFFSTLTSQICDVYDEVKPTPGLTVNMVIGGPLCQPDATISFETIE